MAEKARRISAAGVSTRDRLKLTARRLFAEHGPGSVTVRDILAASEEKNGASLNYYFRSKDDLIREIIHDLFVLMDDRWGRGLTALLERDPAPSVRDLVRLLVELSDTSDVEELPTTARLAETFSSKDYRDVMLSVIKENRLSNYDKVLTRIADGVPAVPQQLMRQRLIFLTRYLSSMFAVYESARIDGSSRQRTMLGIEREQGNLIDTAVGLITAEAIDAR